MTQQMIGFFVSGFASASVWGTGLAIAFGAVWLAAYWPQPLFKRHCWRRATLILIALLAGSAILTWIAIAFIQIPLQSWVGQILFRFWSQETLMRWLLLAGMPGILLSGLVQEGAKLTPVVIYWWRNSRSIDPKLGLITGAIAGAGLGVFEARWVHDTLIFGSGWTWEAVQTSGIVALAGFWERFVVVAFHISASALAGWGLARGRGWQFYLIASGLHALINYSALFVQSGIMTSFRVELFIASCALLITYAALWLRWRRAETVPPVEAAVEPEPKPEV